MTRMCQFIYFDDFSLQFTVMNFAYAKCYDMSAIPQPIQPSNCKLVRQHNHNCKRATALIVESHRLSNATLKDDSRVGINYKKVPDGTFNELAFAMNCALHMNWLAP